jgi:hypothetical protein
MTTGDRGERTVEVVYWRAMRLLYQSIAQKPHSDLNRLSGARLRLTVVLVLGYLSCLQVPCATVPSPSASIAVQWNEATLQAEREANLGAPMTARALAVVDTCMYDAWAAYDHRAVGTELHGAMRRPLIERTEENKEKAISYAAYRALVDLLPTDTEKVYKPLMRKRGYDPDDASTDIETPAGLGNVACLAVLEFRHHDKSNQLGDIVPVEGTATKGRPVGPYDDWSGYRTLNSPGMVPAHFPFTKPLNPDHWQPLTYTDSTGAMVVQMFLGAQWCYVTPFAMVKGDDFRSAVEPGPYRYGSPEYRRQAEELVTISANLTDRQKMIAEYWSDGPDTVQPPGHWAQFAQLVSARDRQSLDDDVKMLFVLSNAMLDAGIAAWDAKRTYDSVRPVTAVNLLFKGIQIQSWGGPGKGTVKMDGSQWIPYEPATFPTSPDPEYVSGHSTYSAAAARILELWTGAGYFGHSVILAPGSSRIEPGVTPAQPVTLRWESFTYAADEAGISQRFGGIHFARADLAGRKLGRLVADHAWAKAQAYFDGSNESTVAALESSAGR